MEKRIGRPSVEIFADGACSGNPGIGGFGVILRAGDREREISGCEPVTTNNRMELTAVIKGLEALKMPCKVRVTTDSNYVVQGMKAWVHAWLKNGWKNSRKQPVANKDLWEKLLHLSNIHDIQWFWIRGHNAHAENERCDELARHAIERCRDQAG